MVELCKYSRGRISLPARVVRKKGISEGDTLVLEEREDEIVFRQINKEKLDSIIQ